MGTDLSFFVSCVYCTTIFFLLLIARFSFSRSPSELLHASWWRAKDDRTQEIMEILVWRSPACHVRRSLFLERRCVLWLKRVVCIGPHGRQNATHSLLFFNLSLCLYYGSGAMQKYGVLPPGTLPVPFSCSPPPQPVLPCISLVNGVSLFELFWTGCKTIVY